MEKSILLAIGISVASLLLWIGNRPAALGSPVPAAEVRKAGQEVAAAGKKFTGILREVTAYNVGVREQTSDTPCIGAGGHDLCRLLERNVKVCAANFVALGTILMIEKFGECVVLDRMHRRFAHRVDVAMREHEIGEALEFGRQRRIVEAIY
jgi:3D (Asp-Asp-Asp) domain-containing protein